MTEVVFAQSLCGLQTATALASWMWNCCVQRRKLITQFGSGRQGVDLNWLNGSVLVAGASWSKIVGMRLSLRLRHFRISLRVCVFYLLQLKKNCLLALKIIFSWTKSMKNINFTKKSVGLRYKKGASKMPFLDVITKSFYQLSSFSIPSEVFNNSPNFGNNPFSESHWAKWFNFVCLVISWSKTCSTTVPKKL